MLEEGDTYAREGKLDEALLAYQMALQVDPDLIPAYLRIGDVLLRQGEFQRAAEQYQEALNREPDNAEAHLKLAFALSRLERWPEAGDHYQAAVELKPTSALAHAGLARYHMAVGDLDSADTEQMVKTVRRLFMPRAVLLVKPAAEGSGKVERVVPFLKRMDMIDGRATAYVCENYHCRFPVTTVDELDRLLKQEEGKE